MVLLQSWLLDTVAELLVAHDPHGTGLAQHVLVRANQHKLMMVDGILPHHPYKMLARKVPTQQKK